MAASAVSSCAWPTIESAQPGARAHLPFSVLTCPRFLESESAPPFSTQTYRRRRLFAIPCIPRLERPNWPKKPRQPENFATRESAGVRPGLHLGRPESRWKSVLK